VASPTARFLKFIVIIIGTALASMAATAAPLVPIVSFLQHWAHHWYAWLPSDPVYEAVEIMAAERGPNSPPLLWVFFTERAAPKHQINYYNDAQIAAARAADGTTAQFADIKFAMTGADGAPRGVSAAFVDFKNRQIAIDISFDSEAKLVTANAGLTDQIGHSGERLLLLFFRERGARAQNPRVTIDGTDVAKLQPGQTNPAPFAAAYSSNIFVGGFPFVGLDVSFDGSAEAPSRGAHFVETGTPGVYEAAPSNIGRVTLLTTADGGLAGYQQHDRTGSHTIEIRFEPPLPPADRLTAAVQSAFGISLDNFRDLLAGQIDTRRDGTNITMDWRFTEPGWARSRLLRTTGILNGGSISQIDLRALKNDQ
jgi:hypothetical protein